MIAKLSQSQSARSDRAGWQTEPSRFANFLRLSGLSVGGPVARGPYPRADLSALKLLNVRFGSKADMCSALTHVRFGPKADIASFIRSTRPRGRGAWMAH